MDEYIPFMGATKGSASVVSRFTHPQDVVSDPHLNPVEKRAVLAAWISDMRTVENQPTLRQWDNGAVASVTDIKHALNHLDSAERGLSTSRSAPRRRSLFSWRPLFGSDDDDDPPPSPIVMRLPLVQAEAA